MAKKVGIIAHVDHGKTSLTAAMLLLSRQSRPRFEPYGGAGKLPTDCCKFAVVDNSTGKEVCRVWEEEDARKIADLLEKNKPE